MTKLYRCLSIFAVICSSIGTIPAISQTFRVTVGTSRSGAPNYMDVYEYDYVSEKPCFPGGDDLMMNFVNTHREYPREAYRKGIQGIVTCSFVVNTNGSISHISIIRGVEASLNKEAMRIISEMPVWTPGKLNGKAVPTRVIWSVPFRK